MHVFCAGFCRPATHRSLESSPPQVSASDPKRSLGQPPSRAVGSFERLRLQRTGGCSPSPGGAAFRDGCRPSRPEHPFMCSTRTRLSDGPTSARRNQPGAAGRRSRRRTPRVMSSASAGFGEVVCGARRHGFLERGWAMAARSRFSTTKSAIAGSLWGRKRTHHGLESGNRRGAGDRPTALRRSHGAAPVAAKRLRRRPPGPSWTAKAAPPRNAARHPRAQAIVVRRTTRMDGDAVRPARPHDRLRVVRKSAAVVRPPCPGARLERPAGRPSLLRRFCRPGLKEEPPGPIAAAPSAWVEERPRVPAAG